MSIAKSSPNTAPTRYYDPLPPALALQIDTIVAKEGGFVQRETEPGGAGKYGVSFDQYKAWEGLHGRPAPTMDQFKEMPRETAVDIYAVLYAPPIWWHLLAPGVNYVLLDSAVNNGIAGGVRIAQRALGLPEDGTVGPVTLWALTHRPRRKLIDLLCDERLEAQKSFKSYAVEASPEKHPGLTWGDIWTKRIAALRAKAHALATEAEV